MNEQDTEELSPEIKEAQERIKLARAELAKDSEGMAVREPEAVMSPGNAETVPVQRDNKPVERPNDLSKLEKQVAELQKELSRRGGEYGSELDRLRKSLQVTADENEMLSKQLEGKKKQTPRDDTDEDLTKEDWSIRRARYTRDLTPEQREAFDESNLDAILKASERTAKEVFKARFPRSMQKYAASVVPSEDAAEVPKLREKINQIESAAASIEFADVVDRMAPGFKLADGNEGRGIPADEGWANFLNSDKDEFQTWREYCKTIGGPKVAAMAFLEYKKTLSEAPQNSPPQIAGQLSPQKSQASAPVADRSGNIYSMKEYEDFKTRFFRGDFSDEPEGVPQAKFAEYKRAAMEGRLK